MSPPTQCSYPIGQKIPVQWPGHHLGLFWLAHADRDPRLLAKEVTNRGEVLMRQRVGRGSYIPLFLIFLLLFNVTSQGFGLGGSILPPLHHHRPGDTSGLSPLPPYMQPFIVDMVGLPPRRVLR
jgi:hypothetical protein